MRNLNRALFRPLLATVLLLTAGIWFSSAHAERPARLDLRNANGAALQEAELPWSLAKAGGLSGNQVSWTVDVVKGFPSAQWLKIGGVVELLNPSKGTARIGSIIVNLQRKTSGDWYNVATDIVNATAGQNATSAEICTDAASPTQTAFVTGEASGPLEFMDASNNSMFAISPQRLIPGGSSITLLFRANFNNTILRIHSGEIIRVEVLLTFSNAGDKGGGGVTCANVDANGDGVLTADESSVRTIPARFRFTTPVPSAHNDQSTLTDIEAFLGTTGTVSYQNFSTDIGGGSGQELLSSTAQKQVSLTVDGGSNGGSISNCAKLDSKDSTLTVVGPVDPVSGLPTYTYRLITSVGLHLGSCSSVDSIPGKPTSSPYRQGDVVTYNQVAWGAEPIYVPANLLSNYFSYLFPSGVQIGAYNGKTLTFTSAKAIEDFLPAGGVPGALTESLVDPTSTSAGEFAGQVLALYLNVSLNDRAYLGSLYPIPFGDLYIKGTGGTNFEGKRVRDILSVASNLLGGLSIPGYTIADTNALLQQLNAAFDRGTPGPWAIAHISPTP